LFFTVIEARNTQVSALEAGLAVMGSVGAYMWYCGVDRLHTASGDLSPINYENSLKLVSEWD